MNRVSYRVLNYLTEKHAKDTFYKQAKLVITRVVNFTLIHYLRCLNTIKGKEDD